MGYWSQNKQGHSFAIEPGVDMLWGDGPADELDSALNDVYLQLGRVPTREEMLVMFDDASRGSVEYPAGLLLQDGLGSASAAFQEDIGREPTSDELRGGFLFSISTLDQVRADFEAAPAAL